MKHSFNFTRTINKKMNKIMNKIMNSITINGIKTSIAGSNVSIINGKVFVDGNEHNTGDSKIINISIEGGIDSLEVDCCNKIDISGDVKKASTMSGDMDIQGSVSGGVNSTSGDIEIGGNVDGNINTVSGDVKCENVGGNINTLSGDVKNKK